MGFASDQTDKRGEWRA